jgi:pyruvate kinase
MIKGRRMTKIVATIGPASSDAAQLKRLLEAGVNVARINCSHASAAVIRRDISTIRRVAITLKKHVAILLDLQGPKIRTGPGQTPIQLVAGDVLTVVMDPELQAEGRRVGTTWPTMIDDVKVGEQVIFADGALSGVVVDVRQGSVGDGTRGEVDIEMDVGGALGAHKGINLPQSDIQAPALTEKDIADLEVGVRAGADYVALSFVRCAADVRLLRGHLTRLGYPDLPVIAKIEKPEAVQQIDEILEEVQGLMVARGDLGVEMQLEQVPVIQKELIKAANRAGVPVITATQMLDSMERNPRPTRAETTDVANAILDGTDALMLSGETSVGLFPVRTVEVMDRIAREVEGSRFHRPRDLEKVQALAGPAYCVARAACYAVQEGDRPLVIFTWSGRTAILASKARLRVPIFALTPDPTVCDRLALIRGVTAVKLPVFRDTDELIAAGEKVLIEQGHLPEGCEVVVLAGNAPLRGAANLMKVEVLDGKVD